MAASRGELPLAGKVVIIDAGHQLGNHNFPAEINRPVPAGGGDETGKLLGSLGGMQAQLLKLIGERLNNAFGPGVTLARLGGDEFGLLSGDCAQAEQASLLAQRTG